jgi:hypothetical protein
MTGSTLTRTFPVLFGNGLGNRLRNGGRNGVGNGLGTPLHQGHFEKGL